MAKRTGADVACLQGAFFDGISEWTTNGYHFFLLNRSGPRQKDGCTIAVSTKFPRTQIRCVHHWMPVRIIGLRLQCGVGRNAGDVYFISAYASVHDERTQTSTSEALRIEFWRKLDGVIRQVPGDSVYGCQRRSRHNSSLDRKCRQPNSRSVQKMDQKWTRTAGGVEIESTCGNPDAWRSTNAHAHDGNSDNRRRKNRSDGTEHLWKGSTGCC